MPKDCWVRNIAKQIKPKLWRDKDNPDIFYTWDYFHENQASAHVEIWKKSGSKIAYLFMEADPFDSSNRKHVPKSKRGRKIEV